MTQGLGGKSNQNANVMALIKEFQADFGTYGGENPGIQTLITYKVLKNMAGGTTAAANTTTGGVSSTVTIRGSTGQTVLTDELGRIVVANVANLLGRMPNLVDGKIPVSVTFPDTQQVRVSNPVTDGSKEATVASILAKMPTLASGRIPVALDFPSLTIANQITGYGTEATLANILAKLPTLTTSGKTPIDLDISALGKDATLSAILAKLPTLASGKTPVVLDFPSNQTVTVSNPSDISALGKDSTLIAILNKLPALTQANKTPVDVIFPTTQRVVVDNPTASTDVSLLGREVTLNAILAKLPVLTQSSKIPVDVDLSTLGKDATLASILAKLPTLVNGKTPVTVDFPANQTVTVSNPSDVSLLGREITLNAILARLPVDISRAIAQGFRTEFTTASPLATAIAATPLTDNPLWAVSRSKRIEGLDSFSHTFLGRRPNTFAASGFTDIAEFDLQTVGSNLRSPTLAGTQTVEIVSSSANDSANGTGVRTVEVMYLDENFILRTTTVNLNGVAAVAIQLNGIAIKPTCLLEVQAIAYGSLQGAAGTITVRIPAGGLLSSPQSVDQITQGDTTSLSARCCVPDGYVGYLTEVSGCAITANHEFRLVATMAQSDKRLLDGVFNSVDLFSLNAGTIPLVRSLPYIELPSRCRVRLMSRASATNASASGGFTIVFVKKPL